MTLTDVRLDGVPLMSDDWSTWQVATAILPDPLAWLEKAHASETAIMGLGVHSDRDVDRLLSMLVEVEDDEKKNWNAWGVISEAREIGLSDEHIEAMFSLDVAAADARQQQNRRHDAPALLDALRNSTETSRSLAQRFDLTKYQVDAACRRHGIERPSPPSLAPPDLLTALRDTGESYASLAQRFGLSKKQLSGIRRRHGIQRPPAVSVPDNPEVLEALRHGSETYAAIGERLGLSRFQVAAVARRNGIPRTPRRRAPSSYNPALLDALRNSNETSTSLAQRFGMTPGQVRGIQRRSGIQRPPVTRPFLPQTNEAVERCLAGETPKSVVSSMNARLPDGVPPIKPQTLRTAVRRARAAK